MIRIIPNILLLCFIIGYTMTYSNTFTILTFIGWMVVFGERLEREISHSNLKIKLGDINRQNNAKIWISPYL